MKRAQAKLEDGTWNLKKFGCKRVVKYKVVVIIVAAATQLT